MANLDDNSHDAFNSLQNQISHLATQYFRDGPEYLPDEVVEKIPTSLPSILTNTNSSKQLRVAYIEHIVSSTITHEMFEPFLFTLAMRRKSMDNLIMEWSESLRQKSKKRETLFRQYILHAAYTSPSAKQYINAAAGIIVDSIFEDVKYFAEPKNWDSINVGIRRIVKLAAETWRYARLEKGVIAASLPDQDHSKIPEPEHAGEITSSANLSANQVREILLPLFPTIERLPLPEENQGESKEGNDGCVYTPGRTLYDDDPLVLPNHQEHRQEKNNVSERKRSISTNLGAQADRPIPRTEAQDINAKSLKTDDRATWPLVAGPPLLSSLQPPFHPVTAYSHTSEPVNGAASSGLATPVEKSAAIRSSNSRRRTPPLSRRSTNATENGSFSDGASTSTATPAALPDWGDSNGAVPDMQGEW